MDRIDTPDTLHLTARGHLTRDDQRRGPYVYLPFDVPFACRRIAVRYRYSDPISADRHEGGNVIDLGLFDPRGAHFPGGAGFRGWSGSRRQSFTIGVDTATPGYLPGPLPAGRYQVILGLYQIWEQGADYVIECDAQPGREQAAPVHPAPQPAFEPPVAAGQTEAGRWLRCDLQSHSEHSDAWGTLEELAARAQAAGLDVLAVTDHNTISHHQAIREYDGPLLLVPGQEATTYHGHMNIWGDVGWCDFRCSTPEHLAEVIALAHERGALCSINHPKVGGPAWEYGSLFTLDALEVWQGPWPHRNIESLALWDGLLQAGRRLPAVGGSDYHCPAAGDEAPFLRIGQPTTWLFVYEQSVAGVLDAIRSGRATISAAPNGPRLVIAATSGTYSAAMGAVLTTGTSPDDAIHVDIHVERGMGMLLRLIADGAIVFEEPVLADNTILTASVRAQYYVRAELVADCPPHLLPANAPPVDLREWRWALTNPIYVEAQHGSVLEHQ